MNLSLKVRVLNFFRGVFKIPGLESLLASATQAKASQHLLAKLVPNPYQYSPGTFKTITRHGITMRVDISDYIGHYLFFGFKDKGMEKLFSLCKPDSKVLDIGANIGWTVLNLGRIANKGQVIGFEPDPYNYERCAENINLNNYPNVRVFPVGLGNENASVNMEIRTPSNRGGNRISPKNSESSRKVEIVRLDEFHQVTKIGQIDLIKMDVEGYELNVLRGAKLLLQKYKPKLFIELDDNNLRDQGDSALMLIEFLFQVGYTRIEDAETKRSISLQTDFANCHFDIIAN